MTRVAGVVAGVAAGIAVGLVVAVVLVGGVVRYAERTVPTAIAHAEEPPRSASAQAARPEPARLSWIECWFAVAAARCGELAVPETWSAADGALIRLKLVV